MDLERTRRVVTRIRKWTNWCFEWFEGGCRMERMAEEAMAEGNRACAKRWFHESAACFHVGQHFFYFDDELKARSLEKIWSVYPKALLLYPDNLNVPEHRNFTVLNEKL